MKWVIIGLGNDKHTDDRRQAISLINADSFQIRPQGTKFKILLLTFMKCIWKYRLQNIDDIVEAPLCFIKYDKGFVTSFWKEVYCFWSNVCKY